MAELNNNSPRSGTIITFDRDMLHVKNSRSGKIDCRSRRHFVSRSTKFLDGAIAINIVERQSHPTKIFLRGIFARGYCMMSACEKSHVAAQARYHPRIKGDQSDAGIIRNGQGSVLTRSALIIETTDVAIAGAGDHHVCGIGPDSSLEIYPTPPRQRFDSCFEFIE